MRVVTHCAACADVRHNAGGPRAAPVYLEVNEDGVAVGQCSVGHPIAWTLQQPRYEILFDWACLALSDGYCREAVATFAASLERFHALAIFAICRHLEIPREAAMATWNENTKLTERQLGAFAFLYAALTRTAPPLWAEKLVNFRNDIVHKGAFASAAKARWFGEACYTRIHLIGAELRRSCTLAWNTEYFGQANERAKKHGSEVMAHVSISPARTIMDRTEISFDETLANFLRSNWWRPGSESPPQ